MDVDQDGWRALWALLRSNDRDNNEIRARHLRAVQLTTPWTLGATVGCSLLCLMALWGSLDHGLLLGWAVGMGALCLSGLVSWWRVRAKPRQFARPRVFWRAALHAALLAGFWGLLPALWFPQLPHDQQLLVAVLVIGNMAAGAIALAMVPPAAWAYVWVQVVCSLVALTRWSGDTSLLVQLLLVMYASVLSVAVQAAALLFMRRQHSEREAARQSEVVGLLLRDFEETTADVLWEVDRNGQFTQVSDRLAAMLERPRSRVARLGLITALQSLEAEGSKGVARLRLALEQGEAFRDQVVRVRMSEGTRWWSVTAKPLTDSDGKQRGWRGVMADVTAERKSHRHLNYLAHYDSLTGLSNRVSLRNRLSQVLEQSLQSSGRRGALMCMDLDNFKAINDSLGHSVGDAVLQEMANRLRQHMRKSDLCGRLGGDEFAVVLDDVRSDEEAEQLAQRLVAAMRVPVQAMGLTVASGVSIGLVHLPRHARSVDEALVAADLALYAAKAAGRGRVHSFTEDLGVYQRRRLSVERELREALVRNQLSVVYQPQVDLATWQIVGAEALVRWNHPELGSVSPVEFIAVAEETGLIHNIGAWVLDRACSDAHHVLPSLRIAVNVSASQVQRAGLTHELQAQLQRHRLSPDRLEIEITESLLMENVNSALENLHAIKELGVRIALDDFGTGYSSLAYLRLFPFDKLKIDRAFIRELMLASDARAIVRTMLELARVLGMDTVAEGVEEPAQLEVLQRVGCSSIQGFLVARPMPAADLAALISRWPSLPRPTSTDDLPASLHCTLQDALHSI
jgi:diguanylate cyclase (GGDEF)-like protein/PAS domain S-box-containing protein